MIVTGLREGAKMKMGSRSLKAGRSFGTGYCPATSADVSQGHRGFSIRAGKSTTLMCQRPVSEISLLIVGLIP
jgi:hypothetical protein